jgi:hypothetical protein
MSSIGRKEGTVTGEELAFAARLEKREVCGRVKSSKTSARRGW